MSNYGLLIGNGFTIDFCSHFGIDPSKPFSHFNQNISYYPFIKDYPAIKELFRIARIEGNDYEAIEKYIEGPEYDREKDVELREFLASSYSKLQLKLEQYNIRQWKWTQWLTKNKSKLRFAVSFNYDLMFEKALNTAGIAYYRTGTTEARVGVPIAKPHGSIDFDLPINFSQKDSGNAHHHSATYKGDENQEYNIELGYYPHVENKGLNLETCSDMQPIPKKQWLQPRAEADLIPPHKENDQRSLHWVREGINAFLNHAASLEHFIIVGISYNDADRKEIDQYLKHLPRNTKIHVVDPHPNEQLLQKIDSLELTWQRANKEGLPW